MSNHINVTGKEAWFNEDARFYKDVYIYGNLYYDLEGTDNLILDNLTVKDQLNIQDLYVAGISTFVGDSVFKSDVSIDGNTDLNGELVVEFDALFQRDVTIDGTLDVENIDVGVATVRKRLELTNEGGTRYISAYAEGPFAGRIGLGSTAPEQLLDLAGSIKIDTDIYDSTNYSGDGAGYYLSQDANGIRWVFVPPDALSEGFFVQNEGTLVGVGSFTTMNFIANSSGKDIVNAVVNPGDSSIVDVYIWESWVRNVSGIHTTSNVGVGVINPSVDLDVSGTTQISQELRITGVATFGQSLITIDQPVIVQPLITGTITTAQNAFISTNSGFAVTAGFAYTAGFATEAGRAGVSTFIETTETLTNADFFITFVENSTSSGAAGTSVRVDSGFKYNPGLDKVTIDGDLIVGLGLTVGAGATIAEDLTVGLGLTVGAGATISENLIVGLGLTVGGAATITGALELNSSLIDINGDTGVSAAKTDYRLASVGSGVSWRPPGVETKNILYVTKDGSDSNSGLLEGDAKATIGGAAAVAQDGDTIYVRPGTYFENNPIGLRTDVSISGQDLRLVTVVPNNPTQDLFHVRRGCLIENMNFAGNNVSIAHTGAAMVAFPPTGAATQNSGYVAAGPANEGPSGRYRSPYIRNCTNFATGSVGMRIDGNHVNAAFSGTNNLGQDLKSMVVDAYTQYNQNGIGVSITNRAYAQLVSIFTINCDIAIFAATGGGCDLTNSNSSFGNFGLYADGTSGDEFTGITTGGEVIAENDTYQLYGIRDVDGNVRKPFDGQGAFFKINLDDYPDTGAKTGIVTEPLRTIRTIEVTNGGSGYSEFAPPLVTIDSPLGPEGILAELSANVSAAGTVSSIDIIASGRNFLPPGTGNSEQNIGITIAAPVSGTQATAEVVTDPILYTINTATEPTETLGISTITFNEFVPYSVGAATSIHLRRLSRIITSSHSFEYVGAGTDINRANPFQGGVPIPENEIVAINGGQIPFTSTDQKGNFRIGQGLTIDQTTSTISGRDFNRAIQANLTPLILALGG